MSIITAILEPHEDGTLHLPIPAELAGGKIIVTATLVAEKPAGTAGQATPEKVLQRMAALARLRGLNPFGEITDPVAWQREIRQDRPIPSRD